MVSGHAQAALAKAATKAEKAAAALASAGKVEGAVEDAPKVPILNPKPWILNPEP